MSKTFNLLTKEIKPNTAQRANFFSDRVSSLWNKLSEETTMANSINAFKNRLDLDFKGYYA